MLSDEALMLEFRAGSRAAFEEIFARYREPLYGFFRRRLDSRDRAEDLTQEAFVAVIRGAARYEPRALLKTYLFGIAWKLLAAERRKANRMVRGGAEPASVARQAGSDAADEELWVRQAVARLDPGEREVLMLREYEQLSYTEICRTVADSGEHGPFTAVPRAHGLEAQPGSARRGGGLACP
jgi:RNA polymerase sigma-70 factor (ECF subfamily)